MCGTVQPTLYQEGKPNALPLGFPLAWNNSHLQISLHICKCQHAFMKFGYAFANLDTHLQISIHIGKYHAMHLQLKSWFNCHNFCRANYACVLHHCSKDNAAKQCHSSHEVFLMSSRIWADLWACVQCSWQWGNHCWSWAPSARGAFSIEWVAGWGSLWSSPKLCRFFDRFSFFFFFCLLSILFYWRAYSCWECRSHHLPLWAAPHCSFKVNQSSVCFGWDASFVP